MSAARRCAAMRRHLRQHHAADEQSSSPSVAAGSAPSRPKALLIFDMQPEQANEDMITTLWLPAAQAATPQNLEDLADLTIATSPEEVAAALADGLRPEILFHFAETGWA